MTTQAMSQFFACLALGCLAGVAGIIILAVAGRWSDRAAALLDDLRAVALWLGWIVALVATLGSLYYSLVAHFDPCPLCWYQRICMYPLAVVLLIAAIRRDSKIYIYAAAPVIVGLLLALYHTQLQAFPQQHPLFCIITDPCTDRDVWQFGFISLPFMAMSAFLFIGTMLTLARSHTDALTPENSHG